MLLASRKAVPAVEYRNLVVQLGLRRELDPDNANLRQLMQDMVAIGDQAGAITLKFDASEEELPFTDGAHPVATFDWENGEIPVSAQEEAIVARVSEVTRIPE